MRISFIVLIFILLSASCKQSNFEASEDLYKASTLHKSMQKLTDIIVHDIISPPVASRMYVYPAIAAYEIMAVENPTYKSYSGQLNSFDGIPKPDDPSEICFPCASMKAFFDVSRHLVFSEFLMEEFEAEVMLELRSKGVPDDVFENSLQYGVTVANVIIDWANKDGYDDSRKLAQFEPSNHEGKWKPTPPDFMDAIEPNWNKLRPFVLDKADQFVPEPPTEFNMDENSKFYKEVVEVYEAVSQSSEEQEAIARFWDCNPFDIEHKGHLMLGIKKITPGGHWVGITSQACRKSRKNFTESAEIYSRVCIALADAFISCWDEKYRSNLIRPETVINSYIDTDWEPILTTPPFPEHTSGHSVISTAAAVTLTHLLGDEFAFIDSVELKYNLPVRSFNSFMHASEEAAVSRLYGGIHYMPAITEGVKQGKKVGNFIIENLKTRVDEN